MKSLLLVVCLGALLAGSTAYPITLIRVPVPSNINANYRLTIPNAIDLCGFNAQCLLHQNIIGIQHPEVQREYETVLRLAILRELMGMARRPVQTPQDTNEEVPEAPEYPQVSRQEPDAEAVPEEPKVPEVPEVPVTRHEDPDSDVSDSDDRSPVIHHRIGMIAVGNGLGIRRFIIFRNVVNDESSDEDADTPAVGPDSSDEEAHTPAVIPDSSDDNDDTAVVVPAGSDDVSPTPEVAVAPDNSDESRHDRPTPGVPDEVPEDRVGDRSGVTPAPVPEMTTELTNSIEQNGPSSTTQSSEDDRESLEDSAEKTDQVEVFDPAKPERFVDFDRFKYRTPSPQIRQI